MCVFLAIETTLAINQTACWVALCRGEYGPQGPGPLDLLSTHKAPAPTTQHLLPSIDKSLKKAGLSLRHIEAIAISQGPGSLTNIRIGLATAHGLALGLDCPLWAVPTFDIVHALGPTDCPVGVVLDPLGRRICLKLFAPNSPPAEHHGLPEELASFAQKQPILMGPGVDKLMPFLSPQPIIHTVDPALNWAVVLAQYTWRNQARCAQTALPLYGLAPATPCL